MATFTSQTNADLVDDLIRRGIVTPASSVDAAMRVVDRADFCPPGSNTYNDAPIPM